MPKRSIWLKILCTAWLLMSLAGIGVLTQYSNKHGDTKKIPTRYVNIEVRESGKHSLLMFVHPKCPCTRASIAELARLMTDCSEYIDATLYCYHPQDHNESWIKTGLWRSADRIPQVHLKADPDGIAAQKFGAATSGQVLVYDADGALVFDGGITAGRGHEGDNAGRKAVMDLIKGRNPTARHLPVFGCAIFE